MRLLDQKETRFDNNTVQEPGGQIKENEINESEYNEICTRCHVFMMS